MRLLLARPAEEGARQLIWAAVATPDESQGGVDSLKGAYVHFSKVMEPSDFVISDKGQEFKDILWVCRVYLTNFDTDEIFQSDTVKILSKLDPRVQPIVDRFLRN